MRDFPGDSVVKKLPANAGDMVWPLDQEDILEEDIETQSRIPWTEEPGLLSIVLQSIGDD